MESIKLFSELGLDVHFVLILFFVAVVAGFVDSIAGGGGMITMPSLLLSGLPPHLALGTNKLQACFGSFSASIQFYKKGYLDLTKCRLLASIIFLASILGTFLTIHTNPDFLARIAPFFLLGFAIYFLFSPNLGYFQGVPRVGVGVLFFFMSLIGFYDGFFGAGTGSFYIFILVVLGALPLREALAQSKFFNLSSNLASLMVFIIGGKVVFLLGFLMGVGQFLGAQIGARLAIKVGSKIIKPMVVVVCVLMCGKMFYDQYVL